MVICIIALVVFGVLGIFSAKYRILAKEAFKCVFRMVTLRPCETGFDRKIKMKVVTKAYKISPRLSGFLYRRFEIFSWIFFIILIISLYYLGVGVYNYFIYGTCDSIQDSAFSM